MLSAFLSAAFFTALLWWGTKLTRDGFEAWKVGREPVRRSPPTYVVRLLRRIDTDEQFHEYTEDFDPDDAALRFALAEHMIKPVIRADQPTYYELTPRGRSALGATHAP